MSMPIDRAPRATNYADQCALTRRMGTHHDPNNRRDRGQNANALTIINIRNPQVQYGFDSISEVSRYAAIERPSSDIANSLDSTTLTPSSSSREIGTDTAISVCRSQPRCSFFSKS